MEEKRESKEEDEKKRIEDLSAKISFVAFPVAPFAHGILPPQFTYSKRQSHVQPAIVW